MKRYTNPLFMIGCILLLVLLFVTFIGPYLPFIDTELERKMYIVDEKGNPVLPPLAPSKEYLLGTDEQGRDLLSILVVGARETLIIIGLISLFRYSLAVPLGYFASHYKVIQSFVKYWNTLFTYLPMFIVLILLSLIPIVLYSQNRYWWMISIIGFVDIGRVAEIYREIFTQLRRKEYVTSGIAAGTRPFNLFYYYFLKPVRSHLIVHIIYDLSRSLLLLAQLGIAQIFFSQIIQQTDSGKWMWVNTSHNWPILLQNSLKHIRSAIWIPFWCSAFIAYAIFTFNLFGEGLKEVFEKSRRYNNV